MDAQLKAKWLEALRSGKYDQGTGQLRSNNCFCCLGVLCDVFDQSRWEKAEWSYGEGTDKSYEIATLPYAFAVRVGMPGDVEAKLIEMNDSGKTFTQIADYIEARL
jgi:hypothetical protein